MGWKWEGVQEERADKAAKKKTTETCQKQKTCSEGQIYGGWDQIKVDYDCGTNTAALPTVNALFF
jgi:hypothetical protein